MTEVQPYSVVRQLGGAELRRYPAHTVVSVQRPGSLAEAGMSAFGSLAGYISGRNRANQQIAMTAPVVQHPTTDGYRVSFVMPASLAHTPAPADPQLDLHTEPGGLVAAIEFSGLANEAAFQRQGQRLLAELAAHGLQPAGEVFFARYNGPWTPPFLRRNEALVAVAE